MQFQVIRLIQTLKVLECITIWGVCTTRVLESFWVILQCHAKVELHRPNNQYPKYLCKNTVKIFKNMWRKRLNETIMKPKCALPPFSSGTRSLIQDYKRKREKVNGLEQWERSFVNRALYLSRKRCFHNAIRGFFCCDNLYWLQFFGELDHDFIRRIEASFPFRHTARSRWR